MNVYKAQPLAAIEQRSAIIAGAERAKRSLTTDEARDIASLEQDARAAVEAGERESEFRSLTAGIGAVSASATAQPSQGEWRTLIPSGEEFRVTQTVQAPRRRHAPRAQ